MRRLCRGCLPVLLLLSGGCETSVDEPATPPVVYPTIERNEEPEPTPTQPVAEAEQPQPTLLERAAKLLPPPTPDMIGDFEVDGVVVRCAASYYTGGGCTASLLLLSLDEDRETGIASSTALMFGRQRVELSLAFTSDVKLDEESEFDSVPILLPANVPVPVRLFWSGVLRKPDLISLVFRHAANPLQVTGDNTQRMVLNWEGWPRMDPVDIETGLWLLGQCDTAAPGTARWMKDEGGGGGPSGVVGIEFDMVPVSSGALSGQFFLLEGGNKYGKPFEGQLTRDDDAGLVEILLQTSPRSGVAGRPTATISSRNLLLRGAETSVRLRLYGHEWIGGTPDGIDFAVSVAPFVDDAPDEPAD